MQDSDPDLVRPAPLNRPGAPATGEAFERIAPVSLGAADRRVPGSRVIEGKTVSTSTLVFGIALLALLIGVLLFKLPDWLAPAIGTADAVEAEVDLAAGEPAGPGASADAASDAAASATAASADARAAAEAAAALAADAAAPDIAAMAADEALLRARQQAQQLAERAAALIASLEAQAVRRWDAAGFAAAVARHEAAGQAFAQRDFPAAAAGQQAAVTALETLAAEVPKQLDRARQAADDALARGDLDAAAAAVTLALAIAPNDAAAQRLQARVAGFPIVQYAMQRAATAEAAGDVRAAAAAYREALAADSDHAPARKALARIDGDQAAARFRSTMADALAALDAGRLDEAERALKAASRLRPGDAGVADAESRLARSRREQLLTRLDAAASAAVAAEDWDTAVRDYGALLAADPTAARAQAGLALARPRAALAARIDGHLAQPARLASEAVRTDAANALAEARAIPDAGAKLRAQIARLDAALTAASTPVPVQLLSDGATEVTIYKVGPQGRFKDKAVALRPGRYTAVGARAGYVDVRVEFAVEAGARPAPVEIRCEEKL